MTKKRYILVFCLFVLHLSPSLATPPLDDVYYWPGWEQTASTFPPADSEAEPIMVEETAEPVEEQTVEAEQAEPVIEYTNVQDTTVTIRINR